MNEPRPPLTPEQEIVRDAYDALNRNDIPEMVKAFDSDIEWIEPADSPGAGTHRGLAVVTAHIAKARGTWAEGSCELQRLLVSGDRVLVFDHVHVRLKHETEWREGPIASVYRFRDGKVIQVRIFFNRNEAVEWSGITDIDNE